MINPFVKVGGVELFGNIETMTGAAAERAEPAHPATSSWVKASTASPTTSSTSAAATTPSNGQLAGITNDITVKRSQVGGGWFVTPNVLSRSSASARTTRTFPTTDIRNGGKFQGFMVEGVVAF